MHAIVRSKFCQIIRFAKIDIQENSTIAKYILPTIEKPTQNLH